MIRRATRSRVRSVLWPAWNLARKAQSEGQRRVGIASVRRVTAAAALGLVVALVLGSGSSVADSGAACGPWVGGVPPANPANWQGNYQLCTDAPPFANPIPYPRSTYLTDATWDPGGVRTFGQIPTGFSGDWLRTTWRGDGVYADIEDGSIPGDPVGGRWIIKIADTGGAQAVSARDPLGSAPNPPCDPTITNCIFFLGSFASIDGYFYAQKDDIWRNYIFNDWWKNYPFTTGTQGFAYARLSPAGTINSWTSRGIPFNGTRSTTWADSPPPHSISLSPLMSFVQAGRDDVTGPEGSPVTGVSRNVSPDGYAYAIATEVEFGSDRLYLARVRPDVSGFSSTVRVSDPKWWEWYNGPVNPTSPCSTCWTNNGGGTVDTTSQAQPLLQWTDGMSRERAPAHVGGYFTYPEMTYDAAAGRYLLAFTVPYDAHMDCSNLTPPVSGNCDEATYGAEADGTYTNGQELVILEAPNPWGPFRYVAFQHWFGPGNGYSTGIPPAWMGPLYQQGTVNPCPPTSGSVCTQDVWLKWAANFRDCSARFGTRVTLYVGNCGGFYTYNWRKLRLTIVRP